MELNDYQKRAMKTCMPSCNNFIYMMMNLVGEVGEFASKIAKGVRKENFELINNEIYAVDRDLYGNINTQEVLLDKQDDIALKLEAGDVLWQLAGLCKVMGWALEDVAQMNLDKLASRQERNVIDGDGDYR